MLGPPDYSESIDFRELAKQDEEFGKIWKKSQERMDWKNAESLIALTKALLKRDFNRLLELPTDRLCPPVPQRYAYIRWVQSLIDSTGPSFADVYEPDRKVAGIDIGMGASCIYPLLGTATRANWNFYGTEIDSESFRYATSNVNLNNLSERIHLSFIPEQSKETILPLKDLLGVEKKADFVMCNPPFFTSKDDMMATWTNKAQPPSAICTGAPIEMITPGGDLGFAIRMSDESHQYGKQVQWFTCMLGKLQSAVDLINHLKHINCNNWAIGTLVAGSKTRRWVVGWSWDWFRPLNDVARGMVSQKQMLPLPTEIILHNHGFSTAYIISNVGKTISSLPLSWVWNERDSHGILKTRKNVWSRFARRQAFHVQKGENKRNEGNNSGQSYSNDAIEDKTLDETIVLVIKIEIKHDGEILLRWIWGRDFVMFESFCGWLKRQPPLCRLPRPGNVA